MELAGVLIFITGLVMLFWGLRLMQNSLENLALEKIRKALLRLAGTPLTATLAGIIITAFVQSSTAVSVFSIGFVNTRLMSLPQAIGIILGANVGTCLTVQLMSLNFGHLALPIIATGSILRIIGRRTNLLQLGQALMGFGLIFFGLDILALAFTPWAHEPWFISLLSGLRGNHLGAAATGVFFTALLHSSATSTGLVIALAKEDLMGLSTAVAFIVGNNVGTCFTALLVSLGSSAAGRRVAAAHLIINMVGALVILPFITQFSALIQAISPALSTQVALAHTLFNVASSLVFLPFIHPFSWLLTWIIPEGHFRKR